MIDEAERHIMSYKRERERYKKVERDIKKVTDLKEAIPGGRERKSSRD